MPQAGQSLTAEDFNRAFDAVLGQGRTYAAPDIMIMSTKKYYRTRWEMAPKAVRHQKVLEGYPGLGLG